MQPDMGCGGMYGQQEKLQDAQEKLKATIANSTLLQTAKRVRQTH